MTLLCWGSKKIVPSHMVDVNAVVIHTYRDLTLHKCSQELNTWDAFYMLFSLIKLYLTILKSAMHWTQAVTSRNRLQVTLARASPMWMVENS
jgi:hypothetical protein